MMCTDTPPNKVCQKAQPRVRVGKRFRAKDGELDHSLKQ